MAKFKVIHSEDACTINITGDKTQAIEPSTAIIKFPHGYVEVARTTQNDYWVHVKIEDGNNNEGDHFGQVIGSRLEYDGSLQAGIPHVPSYNLLQGVSVLVSGKNTHLEQTRLDSLRETLNLYFASLKAVGIYSTLTIGTKRRTLVLEVSLPYVMATGSLLMQLLSANLIDAFDSVAILAGENRFIKIVRDTVTDKSTCFYIYPDYLKD